MNDHRIRNRFVSLADLAVQAPQLIQLARRMGVQRRRQRAARAARQAGWFGAGIALGTGIATLLTPSTGPEMRRRLSARALQVRDYVAPKSNGAAREERA
jgi:hypothetical protein